ncbi:MAG TPA: hypothetical protein VF316_11995 [Polyangiaceae bacterium]
MKLLVNYTPEQMDWSFSLEDAAPTETDLPLDLLEEADEPFAAHPGQEESYIGVLPKETDASERDLLVTRHVTLARAVTSVEKICESFDSVDVSARAAQRSLRCRVGALAFVRNALTGVIELTDREEHAALALPNGLLAAYLAGAYLWLDDVTDALTTLATELNTLIPDWSAVRHRLDEVAWIHEMLVIEQTKIDARLSGEDDELVSTLEQLFATITAFQAKLAEPFG